MSRNTPPFDEAIHRVSKPKSSFAEKPKPLLEAEKVDRLNSGKNGGGVTYCIVEPTQTKAKGERRGPPRKRTRLRCGKILDQKGKFLIECQVFDRTPIGAHLRLMSTMSLPRRIQFYDDEQHALLDAEVIWRQNGELGIQFLTKLDAHAIRAGKRSALAGKYYAVN